MDLSNPVLVLVLRVLPFGGVSRLPSRFGDARLKAQLHGRQAQHLRAPTSPASTHRLRIHHPRHPPHAALTHPHNRQNGRWTRRHASPCRRNARPLLSAEQWLTEHSSPQGSRDHKMEQYVARRCALSILRTAYASISRREWIRSWGVREGLTQDRHGGEPPQVFPLDEAHRVYYDYVRRRCPCDIGILRLHH